VLDWITGTLEAGGVPHVFTFPSSAVALCRASRAAGRHIAGARFTIGGEPITEARLATIRAAGAQALPRYGSIECGPIGYGCLASRHADEVHLLHDQHALILAGDQAGSLAGLRPDSILITALHPFSPFTLINVSMGDSATVVHDTRETCGCPLERLGWRTRLYNIRSYEKLTGGGVTFLTDDVVRVLDEVLLGKFGGAPTDYQICEDETPDGRANVLLVVNPDLGPLEDQRLIDAFLGALGEGSIVNRMMGRMWRESQVLRVERRAPSATRSGKVLHFHVSRCSPAEGPNGSPP